MEYFSFTAILKSSDREVPISLELVIGNQIYIAKELLSSSLRNRLIRLAAFQNPEFYKAQAMRFPTYNIPRIIACAEDYPNHIALPRGCLDEVCQLLSDLNIKIILREELCMGQALNANFQGQLRPEQQIAVDALLAHDIWCFISNDSFWKNCHRGITDSKTPGQHIDFSASKAASGAVD